MRRRDFITLLGGAAAAWPLAVHAQQAKIPTIGVLVHETPGSEQFWNLFRRSLSELGYVEGKNIRFEFRSDQGQIGRLPDLATELVGLKVDIVVPWFTPAATAAKQATGAVPIVMGLAGDPVGTGLVQSLSRPGGNVTGIAGVTAELSGKCVEVVREILPAAHRIAALANAPDPFSKSFVEQVQLAGATTGISIVPIMIHSAQELDAAFPPMERERPDAIIVQPSLPTKRAAELSLSHRILAACAQPEFVHEGGLLSYFAVEVDMYRRVAVFVDKILKGAKPADLPVEQPSKFGLAINLTTAKALGLTIPPALVATADEVIE